MSAPITQDVIRFWCWKAARQYCSSNPDPSNGMFNLANFSNVVTNALSITGTIDGTICRIILTGRPFVRNIDDYQYELNQNDNFKEFENGTHKR